MKALEQYEDEALRIFHHELTRAKHLFPNFADDLFQGISLLGEEFGETCAALNDHTYDGKPIDEVATEAGQTMAVAFRLACFAIQKKQRIEGKKLVSYEDVALHAFARGKDNIGRLVPEGTLFQAVSQLGDAVGGVSNAVNVHEFYSRPIDTVIAKATYVMSVSFSLICLALREKHNGAVLSMGVCHGNA